MFLSLKTIVISIAITVIVLSTPLMIEQKEEFLEKVRTKNIAVFFYGDLDTE